MRCDSIAGSRHQALGEHEMSAFKFDFATRKSNSPEFEIIVSPLRRLPASPMFRPLACSAWQVSADNSIRMLTSLGPLPCAQSGKSQSLQSQELPNATGASEVPTHAPVALASKRPSETSQQFIRKDLVPRGPRKLIFIHCQCRQNAAESVRTSALLYMCPLSPSSLFSISVNLWVGPFILKPARLGSDRRIDDDPSRAWSAAGFASSLSP